ncbi:glycoside hydrolase N-terminal domain-containing protein [Actinoplanes sp. NBRC 101535]|uniref:glycosyl hydrolase family 95 catalytic domain-containing protein n=1 Tax=Actinoplanes sp. NBRC 101535 TaxID=3032196 RepID=UPI0024A5181B|nr:glycoside hydrolase N-terminal domain-containing protein [Actinoplanes sp. NBRC 101535]GLY01315.1 hypothetical protein Acsp01_16940 [Actinoplanes sp. NBRC 101535]
MHTAVNQSFRITTSTEDWEHALISGNGRQGVLCYGSPTALRFTLAHEEIFQPVTEPLPAPATAAALPRLRDLIAGGRFSEAAQAVCDLAVQEHPGYAETRWTDPLIPAATITFTPDGPVGAGWSRGTDFATGVVTQTWDGVTCETFVSRVHDAVVTRIRGVDGTVTIGLTDGRPERPVDAVTRRSGDELLLTARFPGVDWAGALPGYTVGVRVTRTREEVLIVARTTPSPDRPGALPDGDFDGLLAAHVVRHGDLAGRVTLDLGGRREQQLFDAGRYAIISSTGTRPPTLQGVWSGSWSPPWRSGWTVDGNLQAALLSVHSTGTPELMTPLFDLLDTLHDDFRENARRLYGAPGVYIPAHLGSHGRQNHFGPVWCLTFWTAAAAWLARLYLDHWQHTADREFLAARALPFLREVADFHLHVVEIVDGRARFSPSYSPENDPDGAGAQACADATLDVQAVRDLLRGLLALDPDHPSADRRRTLLEALPPHRINAAGELAEWIDPRFGDHHEHRHSSHLVPFLYAGDPLVDADPALHAAAVATVRARLRWWLSEASDEMGYGLALLGVAAAHLGLAAEAYAALERLGDAYWRPTMVPTHNRDHMFNVDVAGAYPALIVAMVLRSRDVGPDGVARVDLLPALPGAWPSGSVRGLVARGPVTVDVSWTPDRVDATLTSPVDRTVELGLPGLTKTVTLRADHPHQVSAPR